MPAVRPDDVVIAILHFAFPEAQPSAQFTADRERLHRAFHNLRNLDPGALVGLGFRTKHLFPESRALDQAISNLESTGLLERRNEEPREYFVMKDLHTAYDARTRKRLAAARIGRSRCEVLGRKLQDELAT